MRKRQACYFLLYRMQIAAGVVIDEPPTLVGPGALASSTFCNVDNYIICDYIIVYLGCN